MYERSAIVLERYLDKLFGFNKEINLKENYENYKSIVEETKNYQTILEEEEDIIRKFDEVAECIQELQRKQNKISAANKKIEEYRIELFNELGDNPLVIEERLKKIEVSLDNNNEAAKQLSKEFVSNINIFIDNSISQLIVDIFFASILL